MPHDTPGLAPHERLVARLWHYVAYSILFLLVYGGVRLSLGYFPDALLFGILIISVLKDVYDEYRLQRGGQPLGYAGFEHTPSNLVLIVFLAGGFIEPSGTFGGFTATEVAIGLAAFDLVFDLSQDLRA